MSALAALICGFLSWPFVAMWRAYCILILWGWFVTPATNVTPPTMYLLVGAMMALHLMLPIQRVKKQEGDAFATWLENIFLYGLLYPAFMLGCGWIWRWLQWGLA